MEAILGPEVIHELNIFSPHFRMQVMEIVGEISGKGNFNKKYSAEEMKFLMAGILQLYSLFTLEPRRLRINVPEQVGFTISGSAIDFETDLTCQKHTIIGWLPAIPLNIHVQACNSIIYERCLQLETLFLRPENLPLANLNELVVKPLVGKKRDGHGINAFIFDNLQCLANSYNIGLSSIGLRVLRPNKLDFTLTGERF